MRIVVDIVVVLVVVGVIAAIARQRQAEAAHIGQVAKVQIALDEIKSQSLYRAGVGDVIVTRRGYPAEIKPEWFRTPPVNVLAGPTDRWMEIVEDVHSNRDDPEYLFTEGKRAAYWYNPYRSILRARVARQITDAETLELYNLVNGTNLSMTDVLWINKPDHHENTLPADEEVQPDQDGVIEPDEPVEIEIETLPPSEMDTALGLQILPIIKK